MYDSLHKYILHSGMLASSSLADVSSFASTVHINALKLKNNEMTLSQFDDGVYMNVYGEGDDYIQRNGINNIKRAIISGSFTS